MSGLLWGGRINHQARPQHCWLSLRSHKCVSNKSPASPAEPRGHMRLNRKVFSVSPAPVLYFYPRGTGRALGHSLSILFKLCFFLYQIAHSPPPPRIDPFCRWKFHKTNRSFSSWVAISIHEKLPRVQSGSTAGCEAL